MSVKGDSMLGRLRYPSDSEEGSAIILTMLMLAVLSGLSLTVFTLSTDNLGNARRDRQATSALANSEAGVGQAIAYLKSSGVGKLICAPNCGTANPWGEEPFDVDGDAAPSMEVSFGPNETYKVWIETVQQLDPVTETSGLYKVHSIGNAGIGPGSRRVEVEVQVAPFEFPLAVFADSVQAGGDGAIHTESLFSTGCIFKRDKIEFQGIDPVHGIPAAAHSAQYITDSQTGGASCAATDNKNIHKPVGGVAKPCNTLYPYDQDRQGGDLGGTSCDGLYAGTYPETSRIADANDLADTYDFQLEGLTAGQLNLLRTAAKEQGFYFTNTTAIPAILQNDVLALQRPNPVLFYDLAGAAVGGLVDLNDLSDVVYGRSSPVSATDPACTSRNVIVVVVNGNVRLNSNQTLVGSIFAMGPSPYGEVTKANGTSDLIGTIYARSLDLTGTADIRLDDCFLKNLPGQLLNVKATNFLEVDR